MSPLVLGQPVLWSDRPGVYVLVDRTAHTGQIRAWGGEADSMRWTMLDALVPITEAEAVARLIEANSLGLTRSPDLCKL